MHYMEPVFTIPPGLYTTETVIIYGGYTEVTDYNGTTVTGAQPNPLGRVLQRTDNGKAYRMIGNIDADYRLHTAVRLHLTRGYDWERQHIFLYRLGPTTLQHLGCIYAYGPQEKLQPVVHLLYQL